MCLLLRKYFLYTHYFIFLSTGVPPPTAPNRTPMFRMGPFTATQHIQLGGPHGPSVQVGGPQNIQMGQLPNLPGMPEGMLQNILGSVLAQHGELAGLPATTE